MTPSRDTVRDSALLAARVLLGVVLVGHGLQKLDRGVGAIAESFAARGIPAAGPAALLTVGVELGGGLLLVAGAFTVVAAGAVVAVMAGAWATTHVGNGLFVEDGGWELVGVIAAGAMLTAAAGAGRFSVDALLLRRSAARRAEVVPAAG